VVTTSNVVHAAVYLVIVLAGAAAQFILLTGRVPGRHPGDGLHRRHRRAVPLRHHAHPGADGGTEKLSRTTGPSGIGTALVMLFGV
jgi:hypothetical protein